MCGCACGSAFDIDTCWGGWGVTGVGGGGGITTVFSALTGVQIALTGGYFWQLLTMLCPVALILQGGGVFCNPKSPSAPAKLRLLYECAPLSLIVEVSWGGVGCDVVHMFTICCTAIPASCVLRVIESDRE